MKTRRIGSGCCGRECESGQVITSRDDVRLDCLIGLVCGEGVRRGHSTFIECALRRIAVIAAIAEEDSALLAHWIVCGVDARAAEHDGERTFLRIAAH